MEPLTIRLKLLEPLMLRGPGEFDPSSRGVYTYAYSLSIPRPSTLIGALISALLSSGKCISECINADSWENLLEKCYIKVLDKLGIEALRGPYITKGGELYVPVALGRKVWIINYHQVRYFLLEEYEDVIEELFKENHRNSRKVVALLRLIERDIRDYLKQQGYVLEPYFVDYTGVHLEAREVRREARKIAKEGYIYTARYISYPVNVEILFILLVRNGDIILKYLHDKFVVKFGGEGRIVRIYIEELKEKDVLNIIAGVKDAKYVILTSPMILREGDIISVPFMGECTTVGHGFSIARKRRKPISPCIKEGSIVKIGPGERVSEYNEALRYGLYSILDLKKDDYYKRIGRLGYASFLPLV